MSSRMSTQAMAELQTVDYKAKNSSFSDHLVESDYASHPSELVKGGKLGKSEVTVQDLRNAIPAHCFQPSTARSFRYFFRDCLVIGALAWTAWNFIPLLPIASLRFGAWLIYGYVQGQQMTGIWVLGHEAGHGNFAPSGIVNDAVGWVLHSALLTPYFSWQSTHRRHHIYANHLVKDHNYVPPDLNKYASLLGVGLLDLEEMTEDSPIVTLFRLLIQQLCGWPWYLVNNITAAQGSFAAGKASQRASRWPFGNSHFNPSSTLFRPEEASLVIASDLGIGIVAATIFYAARSYGWSAVFLMYIQPYLWVNHWIVAITYLHHTHPDVPKYEPEAWTFLRGATATVDRGLGFAGKHLMHNIADFHVIHHLFSRIPQYHAEEATKAVIPLLGGTYRQDKQRNFWAGLWESHRKCQYVVPDDPAAKPENRTMIYRGGPSPPVEISMGRGGL